MFFNSTSTRGPPQCVTKNKTVEAIELKCISDIEDEPVFRKDKNHEDFVD